METKLERWERAVREKPAVAATFGPPNWLVSEEWKGRDDKGKDIEPFEDAVERVRARYFPSDNVRQSEDVGQKASDIDDDHFIVRQTGGLCAGCGKLWNGRGPTCWACQKRRQRG